MCGICGLIDYNHKSAIDLPSAVYRMANRLVHRGPDAEGFWQVGHRRLSIIDLAAVIKRLPDGTAYYDHSFIKKLRLFVDLDQRVNEDSNDIYPAFFKTEDLAILLDTEQDSVEHEHQDVEMTADQQMNPIELIWFQGPLKAVYKDVVLSSSMEALVSKDEARRLLKEHQHGRTDHGHRLWLLLFLHAWYKWWQGLMRKEQLIFLIPSLAGGGAEAIAHISLPETESLRLKFYRWRN